MKKIVYIEIIILTVLITFSLAFAHPGGLDSNYGHVNRATNVYHYHKDTSKCTSSVPAVSSESNPLLACKEHIKYGPPSENPVLLCRTGYILSHNAEHKVADWVAFHLTSERAEGECERSEDFRADKDLPAGQRSELKNYKNSGYDRGHLAPAASMAWNEYVMSESFLLSNMAPQIGIGFNRHIWKKLESLVREWATEREELYVVTGPIYISSEIENIGDNKVSIPTHFYKVIFDPSSIEAIAFILPNKYLKTKDLPTFITSIDDVEEKTGLDFLPLLKDNIENNIEAVIQPEMW